MFHFAGTNTDANHKPNQLGIAPHDQPPTNLEQLGHTDLISQAANTPPKNTSFQIPVSAHAC